MILFLTSPYWLNIRMSWSVTLKMFLQSKLGMPASLCSSGPLYRKLRMSLVVKSVSSRVSSMKSITVGFLKVSCSDWDRSIIDVFVYWNRKHQLYTILTKNIMVIKAKKAVFVFAHLYNAYNAIMLHTLIMFIWTLLWKKAQS